LRRPQRSVAGIVAMTTIKISPAPNHSHISA
jgi:hypothetical protein